MAGGDERWLGWIKALAIAAVVAGGLLGGLAIVDLIAPVAVLAVGFGFDDVMRARAHASVAAGEHADVKSARYWSLFAAAYVLATVVAVVLAWWYLN